MCSHGRFCFEISTSIFSFPRSLTLCFRAMLGMYCRLWPFFLYLSSLIYRLPWQSPSGTETKSVESNILSTMAPLLAIPVPQINQTWLNIYVCSRIREQVKKLLPPLSLLDPCKCLMSKKYSFLYIFEFLSSFVSLLGVWMPPFFPFVSLYSFYLH